ncbi:hypothetical protein WMY93_012804 [Mugilogobius chulae]|uniref:Stereocilin LRR domain-containing protein n=1 Tax=Mugilogobius chulae TaxID=88201 RepID=A0AAW0NZU1_9GOBI
MWWTGVAGLLFAILSADQLACPESKIIHRKTSPLQPAPPTWSRTSRLSSIRSSLSLIPKERGLWTKAELIKAFSVEMGPTMMAALASVTSPRCSPLSTDGESYNFFSTYFRMSDSTLETLSGIQDIIMNILTYLPVSGNLVNAVSSLMDTVIKYTLEVLFSVLQETCEQGDLKQLIMWGLRHNVSWSFGTALIDILLDIILAPDSSLCTYPGTDCQSTGVLFQRSFLDLDNTNFDIYRNIILQCDHRNLAALSDTICPEIVSGSRQTSSVSVLILCQALSSLNSAEMESVWSKACYVLQAFMSPLLSRTAADCSGVGTFPSPAIFTLPTDTPMRIIREASSLNQLACDYNSWMDNVTVDPALVGLCGDNQQDKFVQNVCNNATLMKKLVADSSNLWLYAYCGNYSTDLDKMVAEHCMYDQWLFQDMPIDPYLLEFCTILDNGRISLLICQDIRFFMLLFSNPLNVHLMPNCTQILPVPDYPGTNEDPIDPCDYSLWRDASRVHANIVTLCSQFDADDFNREVCANQTILSQLLINQQNSWLQPHCLKAVLAIPSTAVENFNKTEWCDYQTWASRYVDDSVVGLCWQHDQEDFQKNVCCKLAVFQRLLQDPRNSWLRTVCNETEEIDKAQLLQQVCKYAEWINPIIVDMTEVALCSAVDPDNFISKVCLNSTVFKNLLANQDNIWLIQQCSNHTLPTTTTTAPPQTPPPAPPAPPQHHPPQEQALSHPDPALIHLCWKHDQAKFVSSVCPNPNLLSALTQEPSNAWVGSTCANFTNAGTEEPYVCLAQDLAKKFNWTCSQDLTLACQPGMGQNVMMQMIVRCWLENLRTRMADLLTPEVTAVLDQSVSLAVVSLLSLEETQNTTYHVSENIRLAILTSVESFMKKETDFEKKRVILQCFGRVLTSLMQMTRGLAQDEEFFFIREYFNIPVEKLRAVLIGSHISTIRMILLYYSKHKNTLQVQKHYFCQTSSRELHAHAGVSALQTHLATDGTLFSDLASLLALISPTDIQGLPLLQNNVEVLDTINKNLELMTLDQRQAFGAWFGTVMLPINITKGQQSLIRDTGNLIAYLPFYNFQHLSAAQLLDGLDVLQRNTLSPVKQQFIAQHLIGAYKNLTAQDFIKLGSITACQKLHHDGLTMPSSLLSRLFIDSTQEPSMLTVEQITDKAPFLPMYGLSFIQSLSPSQLLSALPIIKSVTFSPVQASVIVDKLSSVMKLNSPGILQQLGSLVVGVKTDLLLTLTSEKLLSSLPSMAQQTPSFNPAKLMPLLQSSGAFHKAWNTQQAQAIFNKVLEMKPELIKDDFQSLGTVGQGLNCKVLVGRLKTPSSVRETLLLLRHQPSLLHNSLKKCVVDEVYKDSFFPNFLTDFGSELALAMSVSTIKTFRVDVMNSLRAVIISEPQYFLLLSRRKQELLVDKIVQRLSMYTGVYTEEEFLSLGIMATFVADEIFIQLDRTYFIENLEFLQTLCYSTTKMDIIARILQETVAFGPVNTWTKATLNQVGRFLFFLPTNKLQEISQELMTLTRIEVLFMDQRQWEDGPIGSHCLDANEKRSNFEKQQFVLQFFLGFLQVSSSGHVSTPLIVPTCELLHSTSPSVWTLQA